MLSVNHQTYTCERDANRGGWPCRRHPGTAGGGVVYLDLPGRRTVIGPAEDIPQDIPEQQGEE
jgi:hypothetical protein